MPFDRLESYFFACSLWLNYKAKNFRLGFREAQGQQGMSSVIWHLQRFPRLWAVLQVCERDSRGRQVWDLTDIRGRGEGLSQPDQGGGGTLQTSTGHL